LSATRGLNYRGLRDAVQKTGLIDFLPMPGGK
jgi:hypothetical protein